MGRGGGRNTIVGLLPLTGHQLRWWYQGWYVACPPLHCCVAGSYTMETSMLAGQLQLLPHSCHVTHRYSPCSASG
jgi:hypothetical protein